MRIYKTLATADMTFFEINALNPDDIRKRFIDSKVGFVDVPYKQNRMLIFDSSLFHETQPFSFDKGKYTARRINFTQLYGVRSANHTAEGNRIH